MHYGNPCGEMVSFVVYYPKKVHLYISLINIETIDGLTRVIDRSQIMNRLA